MRALTKERLNVEIYESRPAMGLAAAQTVSSKIRELLKTKPYVNIIFASAPSQNEFLASLLEMDVEWDKINGFHMDEYVGLDKDAPQGFGNFLRDRLFGKVKLREAHYMDGNADPRQECARYAALLEKYPTDIVILGIGENTHLAFNDPYIAEFDDPKLVKVIALDEASRQQQINDGCFATMDDVPVYALTITIPPLFNTPFAYAIAPGPAKANAIFHTLNSEIGPAYPSTILRRHPHAILFIDENSASKIK
jgi:glucosamine-6-phosphate deaminase